MKRWPSKWFTAFCVVFGVAVGFLTAAVSMGLWSVVAGEEAHRGLFVLIWMIAAIVFFAWPMQIVVRSYAMRRQRKVYQERIGDLDYEPPTFPLFGTRAPGPEPEGIEVKAPDIGQPWLRRFLARGRTAEQRMADHLKSLELRAEMEAARDKRQSQDATEGPSA